MKNHVRKGREALNNRRKSALIRTQKALEKAEGVTDPQFRNVGRISRHHRAIQSLEKSIH